MKFCTKRSYLEVYRLKNWKFENCARLGSGLTLQSPNFSRPLSRNFFRVNAHGNVLGTSLVKFVWSLTKLLLHYTSTAKEYVEVYLRPGKNVSLSSIKKIYTIPVVTQTLSFSVGFGLVYKWALRLTTAKATRGDLTDKKVFNFQYSGLLIHVTKCVAGSR